MRKLSFMRFVSGIVLISMMGLLAGCRGAAQLTGTTTNATLASSNTTSISAYVKPIPGSLPSDLYAVSPTSATPTNGASTVQFTVPVNHVSVIGIMDISRNFGWISVTSGGQLQNSSTSSISSSSKETFPVRLNNVTTNNQVSSNISSCSKDDNIDACSTAVTLVYMIPQIFSSNPQNEENEISTIKNLPQIVSFANALEQNASSTNPFESPIVISAYEQAITAALQTLPQVTLPPPPAALNNSKMTYETTQEPNPQLHQQYKIPESLTNIASNSNENLYALNQQFTTLCQSSGPCLNSNRTIIPSWSPSIINSAFFNNIPVIGYVYQVDTAQYQSFNNLENLWNESSYIMTGSGNGASADFIVLNPTDPIATNLFIPPQTSLSDIDVINFAFNSVFNLFTQGTNISQEFTPPDPNAVYVIHLYSCSFDVLNPNTYSNDMQLIKSWDPLTQTLTLGPLSLGTYAQLGYEESCGAGIAFAALGVVNAAGGGLKSLGSSVIQTVVSNVIPGAIQSLITQKNLSSATLTPVISGLIEQMIQAIGTQQALEQASESASEQASNSINVFLGNVISTIIPFINVTQKLAALANLATMVTSMLDDQPWEGYVLVTGNPWQPVTVPVQ